MHESGSEPTSHTIPAAKTENRNNAENESRLRGSESPPPEAPRVSHSPLDPFQTFNTNIMSNKGLTADAVLNVVVHLFAYSRKNTK